MKLWILPAVAPLVVAAGLFGLHSALAVFVIYHGLLCLGGSLVLGRDADLGLRTRRGLGVGLVLGAVLVAVPLAAHALLPDIFPDASRLRAVLTSWGIDPDHPGLLLVFMALVNGPVEELFWRGFLQDRLLRGPWSAVALILAFSSYHVFTIGALAPSTGGMALMLTAVVAAAGFWTWSRRRWNSLWPALLSHAGASVGYMLVCVKLLEGNS